jgi:hypothetical protein
MEVIVLFVPITRAGDLYLLPSLHNLLLRTEEGGPHVVQLLRCCLLLPLDNGSLIHINRASKCRLCYWFLISRISKHLLRTAALDN